VRNATRVLAALVLVAALSATHFPARAAAAGTPVCFGAASRDPLYPCVNPALAYTATPTTRAALLHPSAPCRQVRLKPPGICAFGVSPKTAKATVALIGDSHAIHWRAALAVVARTRGWHGLTLSRSTCPFTLAATPPQNNCGDWASSVVGWLNTHPYVHTVFVSANGGAGIVSAPGQSAAATKINGFIRAWQALAPSVRLIVVIRDVPDIRRGTPGCIRRAVARHRNPGVRCARPRRAALDADYEVLATKYADPARVKVIDLTSFICGKRKCYPVVGGALVNKDKGHLTRTFSATLGPYLGRAIDELLPGG